MSSSQGRTYAAWARMTDVEGVWCGRICEVAHQLVQVTPRHLGTSESTAAQGDKPLQPDTFLERCSLEVPLSSGSVLLVPAEKSPLVWKADALLRRKGTKFGFWTEYENHSQHIHSPPGLLKQRFPFSILFTKDLSPCKRGHQATTLKQCLINIRPASPNWYTGGCVRCQNGG